MTDVPYIELPDELDDDHEKNGLNCFLNDSRVCGPDCMAYTTFPSESPYLTAEQQHCSALVGMERLGRYAGGLLQLFKKRDADERRFQREEPPNPKGVR